MATRLKTYSIQKYLSCLLRVVVPHVQPRHSQLQHGIFLGTRGLLDDAIGESLQAMKPMIVISEIKVYESVLDVHEIFHVFFCKVLQ